MNRNPDDLGALWVKTSAKGEYMTGTIGDQRVVVFRNTSDNPKAPQWRVLKARPKTDDEADPRDEMTARQRAMQDDEIPF